MAQLIDVAHALQELTLEEKIKLLAGNKTWETFGIDRLNIPPIKFTDGPQGARGTAFFNGPLGCLFPAGTAMGATFDTQLMHSVGEVLASEIKERDCHVLLGPTVCLQRSPLIGRGFEAFAEDPWLTGMLASTYINGVQKHGVGVSIKHYAAHDQSSMSMEDSVVASQRTLREMHLLPFQLAVKHSNPWSFMTAYHKINGLHASESPWLIDQVLRREWGWDGLVISDWFGTYSTTEAIEAGLDLEMPGPTRWRGDLVFWAVISDKLKKSTIDARVRTVLNITNKLKPALSYQPDRAKEGDTQEKRDLCRKVASTSIVLLKNEKNILPLKPSTQKSYGLIGPAVQNPAAIGGGSSDLRPYYLSTPLEAISEVVGPQNVKTAVGGYSHIFTPLLGRDITVPNTYDPGYILEFFLDNPETCPGQQPLHSTTTTQAQMYFADNLPDVVPHRYWLKVQTVYTAPKTCTVQLGLCVLGKGKLYVDGKEKIDLFTSQPPKTSQTPMFDQASMEVTTDLLVEKGKQYEISVLLRNEVVIPGVGALRAGGLRVGCCEKIEPAAALADAIELAKQVDVPILIAGLSADYESEAMDRVSLSLPPGIDDLIEQVVKANPNTIVVTQGGCPFAMPWVEHAPTLVHAWFGGQETGNAIADVLFGKVNPSGRLSMTFPKRIEDTPAFLNFGKNNKDVYYGEGVFVGYRHYELMQTSPLFYFGYGLSYTQFEYSNLSVPEIVKLDDKEASSFEVSVDIQNTGDYGGCEVVQVYVNDVQCSRIRPRKELKGFTKIWIESKKTATARVTLDKYALSFWNENEDQWLAEKGTFQIIISRSADPRDEVLSKEFKLENDYFWSGV